VTKLRSDIKKEFDYCGEDRSLQDFGRESLKGRKKARMEENIKTSLQ